MAFKVSYRLCVFTLKVLKWNKNEREASLQLKMKEG
jgi:hypothetical protein